VWQTDILPWHSPHYAYASHGKNCISSTGQSPTCTLVPECCKGHDISQWRSPKFDPTPHPNPVSNSHKNWRGDSVVDPYVYLCKSSSLPAQRFHSHTCVTLRTKSVYSASFFPLCSNSLQPRPLDGFDIKYTKTRGSVQGCAFLGLQT